MSIAMDVFADELVTSGITVNYRYLCAEPTHVAGPCRSRHHLYGTGPVTAWTISKNSQIVLTIEGRQIPIDDLRPTQVQTNALTGLLCAAAV